MGHTYYKVHVLIHPRSALTFESLVEALKKRFRNVEVGTNLCVLTWQHFSASLDIDLEDVDKIPRWSMRVYWEDEPHVLEEALEIAQDHAHELNESELKEIAMCDKRISTAGDPDPNMDFFNDYVHVLEVFETFSDVFVLDPQAGQFLN